MSKSMKVLIAVLGIVVVVLLGGAVAVKSALSGAGKDQIVAALSGQLGVPLKVGSIDVNMAQVLSMTPALALGGVQIGNPPGYSDGPMIEAEVISARVDLRSVFSGRPRIIALEVVKPVLSVKKSVNGKTNLDAFLAGMSKSQGDGGGAVKAEPENGGPALAIEDLVIRDGAVRMAGEPLGAWGGIQVALNGFGMGRPLKTTAAASLMGSKRSRIEFTGSLGPFGVAALPVDGKLVLGFAPGELPKEYVQKEFGAFLGAPGQKALLELAVELKGDLYQKAEGPAKVTLTEFMVGQDEQRRLPLAGTAVGLVRVRKAFGPAPGLEVIVPQAALTLAGGQLDGRVELKSMGSLTAGAVVGSLKGLQIEQLLGAFVSGNPAVQGGLTMPKFRLSFAGRNAAETRNSLSGEGSLSLEKGRVRQLDLLGAIVGAIGRTGAMTTDGGTEFATLNTDFSIGEQVLTLTNLAMDGAGLKVNGGGTVTFDKVLDLKLNSAVGGKVAEWMGAKAVGDQPARVNVAMDVTGTTERPKVRPNVKSMAGEAVKNYLGGALDRLFKKK